MLNTVCVWSKSINRDGKILISTWGLTDPSKSPQKKIEFFLTGKNILAAVYDCTCKSSVIIIGILSTTLKIFFRYDWSMFECSDDDAQQEEKYD